MAGLVLGEHVEEPGRKGAVRSAAGEAGNQPSPWRKGQVRASHMWFWNLLGVPLRVGGVVEAEALGNREVLSSALATVSKSPPLPLGGGPWTAARAGAASGAARGWLVPLAWVTPRLGYSLGGRSRCGRVAAVGTAGSALPAASCFLALQLCCPNH